MNSFKGGTFTALATTGILLALVACASTFTLPSESMSYFTASGKTKLLPLDTLQPHFCTLPGTVCMTCRQERLEC